MRRGYFNFMSNSEFKEAWQENKFAKNKTITIMKQLQVNAVQSVKVREPRCKAFWNTS